MNPLEPPDTIYLQAAQGWLELGNHVEADEELDQITPQHRAHPDVLQLRWQIKATAGRWDACLDIATALAKTAPERRSGWVFQAVSLQRLERAGEARNVLLLVIDRFGPNATIPYYLACFCCRLARLDEAKKWLEKAFMVAASPEETSRLKLRALDDPDLEPIWKHLS